MKNGIVILKYIKQQIHRGFSYHLCLTNVALSFTLSGTGDVIQQNYRMHRNEQESWNKLQTYNIMSTGAIIGILCHHWYQFLDHRLQGRTIAVVIKKLLVDQLIFSPVCIVTFIVSLRLITKFSSFLVNLQNEKQIPVLTLKSLYQQCSLFTSENCVKAYKLYVAEWLIWPPLQLVNFYFLPTKYRVLYDNVASLLYDIYSSHVIYYSDDPKR